MYMYMCICICIMYMYIYIYINFFQIPFYEFNPLETKKKYDYVLNKLKLSKVISKDHENKLVLPKE